MKYISVLFALLVFHDGFANCRVYKVEEMCVMQRVCVWDSRGCNVGPKLEAVSNGQIVEGSRIWDNFNTSYRMKKISK